VDLTATISALAAERKPGFASTRPGFFVLTKRSLGAGTSRGFSSAFGVDVEDINVIQFITT